MSVTGMSIGTQREAGRMTTDSSTAVTGALGRANYGYVA